MIHTYIYIYYNFLLLFVFYCRVVYVINVLTYCNFACNSGCRADASEAAIVLLPSNISLFTLDFSGSGLSEGEHVTLGWSEVSSETQNTNN